MSANTLLLDYSVSNTECTAPQFWQLNTLQHNTISFACLLDQSGAFRNRDQLQLISEMLIQQWKRLSRLSQPFGSLFNLCNILCETDVRLVVRQYFELAAWNAHSTCVPVRATVLTQERKQGIGSLAIIVITTMKFVCSDGLTFSLLQMRGRDIWCRVFSVMHRQDLAKKPVGQCLQNRIHTRGKPRGLAGDGEYVAYTPLPLSTANLLFLL